MGHSQGEIMLVQTHRVKGKLGFCGLGCKLIGDEKGALLCSESFGLHWSETSGLPLTVLV